MVSDALLICCRMDYDDLHLRMRGELKSESDGRGGSRSPPPHPDLPPGLGPNTVVVMPEDADEHPAHQHLHDHDLSPRYSNSDYPAQSPFSASSQQSPPPPRQPPQQPVFANQSPSPRGQYYGDSDSGSRQYSPHNAAARTPGAYPPPSSSPRYPGAGQTPSPRQQQHYPSPSASSPRAPSTAAPVASPVRPASSSSGNGAPPSGSSYSAPHPAHDEAMDYEHERRNDTQDTAQDAQ